MKHVNNYQDYIREYNKFNSQNTEQMNEGIKHWLAAFLMMVNMGIVPPRVMASNDSTKMEFAQSNESLQQVASKFESYYNKNKFFNTPEYAWEDFQKEYGASGIELKDIIGFTSLKKNFSKYDINTDVPKPNNYVNDYADLVFPQSAEDSLNAKLSRYEKSSGVEIAVVTVNTIGGEEEITYISSLATDVFEKWGVGKKGANDGILIAISEKDRKWEIRTGYGAEIVLPDALCSRFGRNVLVPEFKAGNYTAGIDKLVDAIINQIGTNSEDIKMFKKQYQEEKARQEAEYKRIGINVMTVIAILAILGLLIGFLISQYKKSEDKKRALKELRDRSENILKDIQLLLDKFSQETKNTKETKYVKDIITEFQNIVNSNTLPNTPTDNTEIIDKLFNYNRTLGSLISKVQSFNNVYSTALNTDSYVQETKKYIKKINDIEKDLEYYNIKSGNIVTNDDMDKISEIVKKNIGVSELFGSVELLLGRLSNVKTIFNNISNTQQSIPNMLKTIENYKVGVNSWIKNLQDYGLTSDVNKVLVYVKELEELLKLPSSEIMKQYNKYVEIERFVNSSISNEKDRLKRIKDEEERVKRRKREEEESEERRRRDSYNSSSSYSSSSSSSDSFGGFGGGSTGGGGCGGSW